MLRYLLERLGLTLNETKPSQRQELSACAAGGKGGEANQSQTDRIDRQEPYAYTSTSNRSAIESVTARLVGLFLLANSTKVFGDVRWHAEERLRTHLRKRHKVRIRYFGYTRFPNNVLYERCGLFQLPKTAPWKRAHALVSWYEEHRKAVHGKTVCTV